MVGDDFLAECEALGYSEKDITRFRKAIAMVEFRLAGKDRLSGERFVEHNLRVGMILAQSSSQPEVVLAGLLHGLDEHKPEIRREFGEDVFSLVEGQDQIKEIRASNKSLEAVNVKKVLLTTLRDVRVILVKIANKLDNLQTIDVFPAPRQLEIAHEALHIYAPLAYRVGAEKMRNELEDLSFKILNPKKYAEISKYLQASKEQRIRDISRAIEKIKQASSEVEIETIKGRPKHVYSIFRKMTLRKVPLNEQYDLLGVRVIVADVKDCYTLLGILHQQFTPIEGRLKDYIANPKPNLYRSIHTGIVIDGKKVEVQIRTKEMDEIAEEGIAAHWKYKGLKSEESFEKKIGWLRGILDLQKSGSKEFLEAAKVDVFGDVMYCYTPKGDLKELPRGASVLDFAFHVHEQVGLRAIAGRVNGKFSPLREELHHGDVVEIETNKNQHPSSSWLKWVKTAHARSKIRRYLSHHGKIPAPHYRVIKPKLEEDKATLVSSLDFPTGLCTLAKCCSPIPGEEIVGITTKKRVISVHKPDCRQALREQDRWSRVEWNDTFSSKIRFVVKARERSGLLADLLHNIASAGFQVSEAKAKLLSYDDMECSFLVIPRELEALEELNRRIFKVKGVAKISYSD